MASTLSAETENPVLVPETLLRRRKSQEKAREERAIAARQKREKSTRKKEVVFTRAEKYVKQYRDRDRERRRMCREAKLVEGVCVGAEARLAFVVRIKGREKMDAKKQGVLRLLRLLQINHGVFIKLSKATVEMLKMVEPLVAYGYPNQKSVRELIYKRGYGRVDKQRLPLTDNEMIEEKLGQYGIICMEDLVHEIYTVGPSFKQASNFLCPFALNSVGGGSRHGKRRRLPEEEGSEVVGNQEENINELIKKMN